jgi:mRNA-degrading endonuclease RelE of RelBE toxin-antitoxin system
MTYTIIVTKSIQKDLDNLRNDIKTRVYSKISYKKISYQQASGDRAIICFF